jgi:hypothetical protein
MIVKYIEGFTRALGAPADWDGKDTLCGVLPVRDVVHPEGNFMVSAWEPSPDELEALRRGETVKPWVRGTGHPVVGISVGDVG